MEDVQHLLSLTLNGWQQNQGLPAQSADEQLLREGITQAQYRWLETFSRLWDVTQEQDQINGN